MAQTTLYGMPTCACVRAWLPLFLRLLARYGITVRTTQLTGTYSKSGGTHGGGGAIDLIIENTGGRTRKAAYWLLIKLARQAGADPSWHRKARWDNADGIEHGHLTLRACDHRASAAVVQERAVDAGLNGLANRGRDDGYRPLSRRGWRKGTRWMRLKLLPSGPGQRIVTAEKGLQVRTPTGRVAKTLPKGTKFRVVKRDPDRPDLFVTLRGQRVSAASHLSRKVG